LKKLLTLSLVAALVMGLMITPTLAKGDKEAKDNDKAPAKRAYVFAGYQLATSVLGVTVVNIKGKEIGEIKDLVINGDERKVEFAIVETGAILDLGGKLVPVPWKVFMPGMTKDNVSLKMSKDVIKKAPNYSPADWPKLNTQEWRDSVMSYYEKNMGK
jgi:hypothetical protein